MTVATQNQFPTLADFLKQPGVNPWGTMGQPTSAPSTWADRLRAEGIAFNPSDEDVRYHGQSVQSGAPVDPRQMFYNGTFINRAGDADVSRGDFAYKYAPGPGVYWDAMDPANGRDFSDWLTNMPVYLGALMMGGLPAAGAGAGAGAGAAASGLTEGATLASEAGFVPGSFELGASGYGGTAATGLDAAGAAAGGTAAGGAAGGGMWDWLADYGLTPTDVGLEATPFNSSASVADLGGNAGMPGGTNIMDMFKNMPPGASTVAQQLMKLFAPATGGAGAGGTPGAGGTGAGGVSGATGIASIIAGLMSMMNGGNAMDPAKLNALWGAGMDTYNLSKNPMGGYDRAKQGVIDQSRSASSARGLAMSPYSAGVENKAVGDFNIDWGNNQLARQNVGVNALAQASGGYFGQSNADRTYQTQQNTAGTNALLQGAAGIGPWLSGLFGNSSPAPTVDPYAAAYGNTPGGGYADAYAG